MDINLNLERAISCGDRQQGWCALTLTHPFIRLQIMLARGLSSITEHRMQVCRGFTRLTLARASTSKLKAFYTVRFAWCKKSITLRQQPLTPNGHLSVGYDELQRNQRIRRM